LHEKYKDRGFTVIAVNAWDDSAKDVKRFMRRQKLNHPTLLQGGDAARKWGVASIPANFILDRDGKIRDKSVGFHPGDVDEMQKTIEKLLK
jgi:peroxiredoxin